MHTSDTVNNQGDSPSAHPMVLPDGKSIPPTGKRFAIGMATISHWHGTTMDHEWLFWDNQEFIKQIGLGQYNE